MLDRHRGPAARLLRSESFRLTARHGGPDSLVVRRPRRRGACGSSARPVTKPDSHVAECADPLARGCLHSRRHVSGGIRAGGGAILGMLPPHPVGALPWWALVLGGVLYGAALIWLGAFLWVKNTPTSAAFGRAQE